MRAGAALVIASSLLAAGCAGALRKPLPPPPTPTHAPAEVDGLLAQAEQAYAGRTLESVRRSAELWDDAAAADPARVEGWIGVVRARSWLSEKEADDQVRAQSARAALDAGRRCASIAPERPECSYWLGVALGEEARARPSTALGLLGKMADAFRTAAEARPEIDRGGPDRALAQLLARAPGWPTGPGDPDEALEHARRAVEIDPQYPPNVIALAECLDATGREDESLEAWSRARELAGKAARSGDPDAADWLRDVAKRGQSKGL